MCMKWTHTGLAMSVCPMIKLKNRLTDSDEISYELYATGVYPKIVHFNFLQSVVEAEVAQSVVSGYGLDDQVRYPAKAKDFSSSLCVQTRSGAHPASCPVGTGGPFPGGKTRLGRDADHSLPSSAEVENE
jgi:hypothetical protein